MRTPVQKRTPAKTPHRDATPKRDESPAREPTKKRPPLGDTLEEQDKELAPPPNDEQKRFVEPYYDKLRGYATPKAVYKLWQTHLAAPGRSARERVCPPHIVSFATSLRSRLGDLNAFLADDELASDYLDAAKHATVAAFIERTAHPWIKALPKSRQRKEWERYQANDPKSVVRFIDKLDANYPWALKLDWAQVTALFSVGTDMLGKMGRVKPKSDLPADLVRSLLTDKSVAPFITAIYGVPAPDAEVTKNKHDRSVISTLGGKHSEMTNEELDMALQGMEKLGRIVMKISLSLVTMASGTGAVVWAVRTVQALDAAADTLEELFPKSSELKTVRTAMAYVKTVGMLAGGVKSLKDPKTLTKLRVLLTTINGVANNTSVILKRHDRAAPWAQGGQAITTALRLLDVLAVAK